LACLLKKVSRASVAGSHRKDREKVHAVREKKKPGRRRAGG